LLLACIVIAANVVFLVSALLIQRKFKDYLEGSTLKFALDNPALVRDKALMAKRGPITVDAWELAVYAVVFPVVIFLFWDDPSNDYDRAWYVSVAVAAIAFPWFVFLWSSGSVYVLSDTRMTRLSPVGRQAHIEWRRVEILDYDPMREVFLIGDGHESFSIDTLTKNWRYFFEYAKARVPKEAWTDLAEREVAEMQTAGKNAGPHMIRQAKGGKPY